MSWPPLAFYNCFAMPSKSASSGEFSHMSNVDMHIWNCVKIHCRQSIQTKKCKIMPRGVKCIMYLKRTLTVKYLSAIAKPDISVAALAPFEMLPVTTQVGWSSNGCLGMECEGARTSYTKRKTCKLNLPGHRKSKQENMNAHTLAHTQKGKIDR